MTPFLFDVKMDLYPCIMWRRTLIPVLCEEGPLFLYYVKKHLYCCIMWRGILYIMFCFILYFICLLLFYYLHMNRFLSILFIHFSLYLFIPINFIHLLFSLKVAIKNPIKTICGRPVIRLKEVRLQEHKFNCISLISWMRVSLALNDGET